MVCCCLYIRFSTSPLILDKDTTQVSFIAGIPVLTKVRRISQNAAATDEATTATFKSIYLSSCASFPQHFSAKFTNWFREIPLRLKVLFLLIKDIPQARTHRLVSLTARLKVVSIL